MKEKDLTRSERYALMLYRRGKEKSKAMPRQYYMDPASSVMFESEKAAKDGKRGKSGK